MQFTTLFRRAVKNAFRSRQSGIFRLVQAAFTGVIFGLIYLSIPNDERGIQTRAVRGRAVASTL